MSDQLHDEIDKNYEALTAQLPQLLPTHLGKFALMHNGGIIDFFDTARDAQVAGNKLFPDGVFSVQEVIDIPVDLGYFSHALPSWAV